jgi:hypothetical protein
MSSAATPESSQQLLDSQTRSFSPSLVPGPLQTSAYARAVALFAAAQPLSRVLAAHEGARPQ